MRGTRLGIFGGSFDPPHLGHTLACLWALESGEVDGIVMIPTARHAFGKQPSASFTDRMAMCRVAVSRLGDLVEVSDMEGRREGVSYMADTLREVLAERPGISLRLIVGTDVAGEVSKWRDSAEVLRLSPLLVLPRLMPGDSILERPGALPAISSTQVRESLRSGSDAMHFIGHDVREYIRTHGLYRDT